MSFNEWVLEYAGWLVLAVLVALVVGFFTGRGRR